MKRLREMSDADPEIARAQELLSAVEPVPDTQARMMRVRHALEAERAPAPRRQRMAFAWALLLVFAGTAFAAAQGVAAIRAIFAPAPRVEGTAERMRPASKPRQKPLPTPAVQEVAPVPRTPVPALLPEQAPPARPARAKVEARASAHEQKTAESELVRQAVMALRRDGDAERAARLLELSYARSPDGALAEEVMSLRVEAALLRGDQRAPSYAKQYLARYPDGRYRALAQKALGAKGP